jgi:hypothetical protein
MLSMEEVASCLEDTLKAIIDDRGEHLRGAYRKNNLCMWTGTVFTSPIIFLIYPSAGSDI